MLGPKGPDARPSYPFFISDLLGLRFCLLPLAALRDAFAKCVAHTSGLKGVWITKQRNSDGEAYFDFEPTLKALKPYVFRVLDWDGGGEKLTFQRLAELFLDTLDYEGADVLPYAPGACPPPTRFFNLFPGFRAPVGPAAPKLIAPILSHLLVVLAAGVDSHYVWFVNWLANLVKNPSVKPGTIVVLRSEQGAGKDCFIEFFGLRVLGPALFFQTPDIEKATGRFNSAIEGKRLVAFSELGMPTDKFHPTMERVKSLTTDPTLTIERKGQEPRPVKDYSAYIVASNSDSPLRVERSGRRTVHGLLQREGWRHGLVRHARSPGETPP